MTKKKIPITRCGYCGKLITDKEAATIEEILSHRCKPLKAIT
jgi:hypothetical protein